MVLRRPSQIELGFKKLRQLETYSLAHVTHCLILTSVLYLCVSATRFYKDNVGGIWNSQPADSIPSRSLYYLILISSVIGLCAKLYMVLLDFYGMIFYECFPGPVQLKAHLSRLPRISFRIVTRGDYPDLVNRNAKTIRSVCLEVGLKNFIVEIVTEKMIDVPDQSLIKVIVVPKDYLTPNGTLFKGRNLQYCLEEGISCLRDSDWIVHLDEDSVVNVDAVKGVANFVQEGKCKFGVGETCYDPDNITSVMTKLLTKDRVVYDYGLAKAQCKPGMNFPVLIKGSFVACNVGFEKEISFDGGPGSSIMEFMFFSYAAHQKGYKVGWIEGRVIELGPLTVKAFIIQVTRIVSGLPYLSVFPARWRNGFKITANFVRLHVLYVVTLITTLIWRLDFHTPFFLTLVAINVGHDIYNGIFFLFKKYSQFSLLEMATFFAANLILSPFFINIVYFIGVTVSLFQKGVSFSVTKKTI